MSLKILIQVNLDNHASADVSQHSDRENHSDENYQNEEMVEGSDGDSHLTLISSPYTEVFYPKDVCGRRHAMPCYHSGRNMCLFLHLKVKTFPGQCWYHPYTSSRH